MTTITGLYATHIGGSFAHGRPIIEDALPASAMMSINQMANNARTPPFPR